MAKPLVSTTLRHIFTNNVFNRNILCKHPLFRFEVKSKSTFEAATLKEYKTPLDIQEFNAPELKPSEVRISVKYCSLNTKDVHYIEHARQRKRKLPFVPGYELSGEVLEIGNECSGDISVGHRVVALAYDGGLATQTVVNEQNVWELPTTVPTKDAAALVCGHATAFLAFTQYRMLEEGDVVLVIAGPAGFGLAAVEVAASIFKAKVIAVTDSNDEASLLRQRGAFAVFKSDLKRNYKEIMEATNKKGVSVIYDAVGGPILNTVIKCITTPSDNAVLATYDPTRNIDTGETKAEETDSNKLTPEVIKQIKTVNIYEYGITKPEMYRDIVNQVVQYCDEELISAHVSKIFDLKEVNDAIEYIKGKNCTGKVLVKIPRD